MSREMFIHIGMLRAYVNRFLNVTDDDTVYAVCDDILSKIDAIIQFAELGQKTAICEGIAKYEKVVQECIPECSPVAGSIFPKECADEDEDETFLNELFEKWGDMF